MLKTNPPPRPHLSKIFKEQGLFFGLLLAMFCSLISIYTLPPPFSNTAPQNTAIFQSPTTNLQPKHPLNTIQNSRGFTYFEDACLTPKHTSRPYHIWTWSSI